MLNKQQLRLGESDMPVQSEKNRFLIQNYHFRRSIQFSCLAAGALFLIGCAGVGNPIPNHFPDKLDADEKARLRATYEDPLDMAYLRIDQWSRAVNNLQTTNTAASSALLPLAAIIGYRTARNKSAAATAGLATGGIIGLTLSDALIQINRLDVYLKGIEAMECAANHYRAARIPPESMDAFWERYPELKADQQARILLSQIYTSIFSESLSGTSEIRLEMANSVSRITSEVNQALRSSIVSVHDLSRTTLPEGAFRQPLAGDRSIVADDPAEIARSITPDASINAFGKNFAVSEDRHDQLTDALLELDRMKSLMRALDVNQDEVARSIRSCSIIEGLNPSLPDRIGGSAVTLEIISDEDDQTLTGCEGSEQAFPIAGGTAPFTAQLLPDSDKISASVQGRQLKISVTEQVSDADLNINVAVWDKDGRYTSLAITVSKTDVCGGA